MTVSLKKKRSLKGPEDDSEVQQRQMMCKLTTYLSSSTRD